MSVFTNLTGGGTSSVASATTASITPGGNRLILVTVHAYLSAGSVQPATPTVTGNGITYSLVASQDTDNSGTDRGTMFLFRGMASAPTAGGITIDFGATTQTRIQWAVDQSGPDVDTSGTNGSGAIIQSTGVTLGAAGTSASVNFPSAMGAGNVGFSAWGHQVQEGKTPRAGWTELADVTTVSLASVETQYISGTDTAGSASWTTSSRAGGVIAEIKSAIGIRGTTTSGTGDTNVSSKTVPVPTGAAVDDIAIVIVDQWTSATERTATITGFTEITGAHATRATTGTAGTQTIRMFWKRLTAADTGNYTVTFSGTTWNMAHCVMFSGGLASGDPIEVVNTANATSGYPTTTFTVSTLAGLVNSAVTFNAITTTPPTGFTEQQDTNVLHTSTRILTGTGSITASGGTSGETDTVVVAMIAVQPAASGGSVTADATLAGTATLTTTAASAKSADATLTGTATGTANVTGAMTADGALAGTATLASSATPSRIADGSLAGTGALSASASGSKSASASASATGTLTAAATNAKTSTGTLGGTGTLATTAASSKPIDTALSATGTLAATATVTSSSGVDATLSGTGTLASGALSSKPAIAALNGTGALATAATVTQSATAALAGTGTLSSTAVSAKTPAATLTATGTLTSTATVTTSGASIDAVLSGTGTRASMALLTKPTTAALSATASAAAQMVVTRTISGSLTGAGSLTASADSAGQITIRPNLGTTSRPGSGRTIRPDTGTTVRP